MNCQWMSKAGIRCQKKPGKHKYCSDHTKQFNRSLKAQDLVVKAKLDTCSESQCFLEPYYKTEFCFDHIYQRARKIGEVDEKGEMRKCMYVPNGKKFCVKPVLYGSKYCSDHTYQSKNRNTSQKHNPEPQNVIMQECQKPKTADPSVVVPSTTLDSSFLPYAESETINPKLTNCFPYAAESSVVSRKELASQFSNVDSPVLPYAADSYVDSSVVSHKESAMKQRRFNKERSLLRKARREEIQEKKHVIDISKMASRVQKMSKSADI